MNGWNWQTVVTLVIVAGAVVALARRAALLLIAPEKSGCGGGGCTECPASHAEGDQSIVQLNVAQSGLKTNSTEPV